MSVRGNECFLFLLQSVDVRFQCFLGLHGSVIYVGSSV